MAALSAWAYLSENQTLPAFEIFVVEILAVEVFDAKDETPRVKESDIMKYTTEEGDLLRGIVRSLRTTTTLAIQYSVSS